MKIFLACDHAGLELKESIKAYLSTHFEVEDFGTNTTNSVDYPDFADSVCRAISKKTNPDSKEFGILICGSGQGMSMRANKYSHIRAALVYNAEIAKLSREHNNANVLCIGSRFCSLEEAKGWIEVFLNTPFAQGRHQTRVAKVSSPAP